MVDLQLFFYLTCQNHFTQVITLSCLIYFLGFHDTMQSQFSFNPLVIISQILNYSGQQITLLATQPQQQVTDLPFLVLFVLVPEIEPRAPLMVIIYFLPLSYTPSPRPTIYFHFSLHVWLLILSTQFSFTFERMIVLFNIPRWFIRLGGPGTVLVRGQCVKLRVSQKEQWRPQKFGEAKSVDCLRKPQGASKAVKERSQVLWSYNHGSAIRAEPPNPISSVLSFFLLDFCRLETTGEASLGQVLGIQASDIC